MENISLTIAIDGTAASGKGTLARKISKHFDIPHLDTGLTYRAVGHALVQVGLPLDSGPLALIVARNLDLSALNREVLSTHEIGEAASKIAVMSGVRAVLVEAQKKFANSPHGAVLDGRDIGTVVCPDADVKLFIDAKPEIRAERRQKEATEKGGDATFDAILADIIKRDERDRSRKESPLKQADDAHLIDTSEMSIETAFETAVTIIDSKRSRK